MDSLRYSSNISKLRGVTNISVEEMDRRGKESDKITAELIIEGGEELHKIIFK